MNISPHFTLAEAIKSQTALRKGIDNKPDDAALTALKLVAEHILEPCRNHFARPFSPSSWYRGPELNRAIGSSDRSQHVKGQAVDFEIPGISNIELARHIADNLDFDQLILEFWVDGNPTAGWVHCSYVGPDRNRRDVLTYDGQHYSPGFPGEIMQA